MSNKKMKSWTIILSSSPQSPIKQFQLRKLVFYFSISFVFMLFIVISALSFSLKEVTKERNVLTVKLDKQIEETEKIQHDYFVLQQEALTVQRTVEQFKQFQEHINNLNLEMPIDIKTASTEGSGGLVYPMQFDEEVFTKSPQLLEIQEELPNLIQQFEETIERLTDYEQKLRTVPTIIPAAEGRITSRFGNRRDPFNWRTRFHSGIDIAAPLNTPIFAAADGVVTLARNNGGYGLTVVIDHGSTYETLYAHLNRIDVEVGDKVKKGDVIGGMGTTGRSTGVHLHYEIKRNGEHIDPYLYMTFHDRNN